MKKIIWTVFAFAAIATPAAAQTWSGTTYDFGTIAQSTWVYQPPVDYRSTFRTLPTFPTPPTTVNGTTYRFGDLQMDTYRFNNGRTVNCSTYNFGTISQTNCR